MKKNIILLENHPIYSAGLKAIISLSGEFNVSACCRTEKELFHLLGKQKAEIVILDSSGAGSEINVIQLVHQLTTLYPKMSLLAVGENDRHRKTAESLYPLVEEYFCKTMMLNDFTDTLHHVMRRKNERSRSGWCVNDADAGHGAAFEQLTARETVVISYIHAGLSVTQTAKKVNRSVKTISAQKRNAMKKLGLRTDKEIYSLNMSF